MLQCGWFFIELYMLSLPYWIHTKGDCLSPLKTRISAFVTFSVNWSWAIVSYSCISFCAVDDMLMVFVTISSSPLIWTISEAKSSYKIRTHLITLWLRHCSGVDQILMVRIHAKLVSKKDISKLLYTIYNGKLLFLSSCVIFLCTI